MQRVYFATSQFVIVVRSYLQWIQRLGRSWGCSLEDEQILCNVLLIELLNLVVPLDFEDTKQ